MEKRIRKHIILFVCGFILMNTAASLYFLKVSSRNFRSLDREKLFWQGYEGQEFLVMGHSRGFKAVDTTQFASIDEYCSGGEVIFKTYYKLEQLVERTNDLPKVIIMPFGAAFHSISKPGQEPHMHYWSSVVDYIEMGNISGNRKQYWREFVTAQVFPYHRYPSILLQRLNGEHVSNMISPKNYVELNHTEREQSGADLVDAETALYDMLHPATETYLVKIMDLAKAHNIRLVFVKFPITKPYRELLDKTLREAGKDPLAPARLVHQRPIEEVMLIDLSNSLDDCPECFRDSQHLLPEGAHRTTKRLLEIFEVWL